MDKRQRMTLLGIAAAIAAIAVAIALVAGGGDDSEDTTAATQATETQRQPDATGATTTEETKPPEPEQTRIRIKGGEPVGGEKEIKAKKGDTVRIAVTGDAPESLHLHGYDIERPLEPGKTTRLRFEADIEGVFEIELEHSGTPVASLTVEP